MSGFQDRTAAETTDVVAAMTRLVDWFAALPIAADDAERIDRIAALERLRGAVAAAQARETCLFAASQSVTQAVAGVPARHRGRGTAEQIGLARRMSPATAARQLTIAQSLSGDLPTTLDQLRRGEISEWIATIVVRETTGLPRPVRQGIAADLAPDLPRMGPRQAEAAARRAAYTADPEAVMARSRTAHEDRRVSIRPAPDTMALLTGYLPAEQAVAAWGNLTRHARTLKTAGDERSHGQLMADTLVERLTGQATADAVPVEVGLTMTLDSLLAPETDPTPADLRGYGPVPAQLALDLVSRGCDDPRATTAWVHRLITDPVDQTVAHVDTRRRRFDGALARLIRHRDQVCRDPYCAAEIRHLDHVRPHRDGGPTTAANGTGLCERGNYVKDMPGWSRRVVDGAPPGSHIVETTTPTGHTYTSTPPPVLGPGSGNRDRDDRNDRGTATRQPRPNDNHPRSPDHRTNHPRTNHH